ncbi:glycosyltransferase family 25 protein [Frigidibacter sp.]|uniref:glycosyltransferase family 25 protein n=1 Tax=Frigidibacter sp. TaxID=2586418 RepID=UPI00273257F3|nr:glycosyltransferase family 25 protein [Frigidibacter sp.]MDP3340054.1 glycosyltransferase family 25 protein [Frigidibacter sp.]
MSKADWTIRIVTLETDINRRAPLLRRLEELGLAYELSFGFDGRTGCTPDMEARIDRATAERRRRRPLTDAEFACALSHRHIYEIIIARDEPGCIVLEDDAQVGPAFASFVRSGAYRGYPMLLLDYGAAYVWPAPRPLGQRLMAHRLAQTPGLATGYTLDRSAAQALLRATNPVCDVADWPMPLERLGAALVAPRIVGHPAPGVLSNIDAGRLAMKLQSRPKSKARYLTAAYWRWRWAKRRGLHFPIGPAVTD